MVNICTPHGEAGQGRARRGQDGLGEAGHGQAWRVTAGQGYYAVTFAASVLNP